MLEPIHAFLFQACTTNFLSYLMGAKTNHQPGPVEAVSKICQTRRRGIGREVIKCGDVGKECSVITHTVWQEFSYIIGENQH